MTIQERAIGSIAVLDLSGRLVLGDGDALLKDTVSGLVAQGRKQILLNVADVSYVDSSGLGTLVAIFLATRKDGGVLKLLNPSKRLHDLLKMARLLTVLDICETEDQAHSAFGVSA